MKKNFGPILLFYMLWLTGSVWAQINCDTQRFCQNLDDGIGAYQPAVRFQMTQAGPIHLRVVTYGNLDCDDGTENLMIEADLELPAGNIIIPLNLNPPLDPGAEIGIKWDASPCAPGTGSWLSACTGYTVGVDPAVCGAEDSGKMVSVLDLPNVTR